ncbi:MAG: hypothetical protein IPN29_15870 [Saprospiraceae bacterium]|nr:hypothetical protein [Saprospiraceae bacterium]
MDSLATTLIIDIDASFTPLISTYRGSNCDLLQINTPQNPCFQGNSATISASVDQTVWIKVEALNGINLGDF